MRLRRTVTGSLVISLVVTLKWVYELKRDKVGAIIKHKARVVA
jgi:hypothetical protein